jgi:hypothetical protein
LEDEFFRHDPFAQDAAVMVDVMQKKVYRLDALQQPRLKALPFMSGDGPRDQIEGKNFLHAAPVGVNGKSDALIDEDEIRVLPALLKIRDGQLAQPLNERIAVFVRLQLFMKEFIERRRVPGIVRPE